MEQLYIISRAVNIIFNKDEERVCSTQAKIKATEERREERVLFVSFHFRTNFFPRIFGFALSITIYLGYL